MVPAVPQTERSAGLDQGVEYRQRKGGRNVELPAQLAHVGQPQRESALIPELDLPAGAERKPAVGKIIGTQSLQQRARPRPLHVQHRVRPGQVGHHASRVRGYVTAYPRFHVRLRERGRHDQEPVDREA